MFSLITWIYKSLKYLTHKGDCISGHYLLKLGYAQRLVSLAVQNSENFFLEDVTLKLLFGWGPNLDRLCLITRENFVTLERCGKLWCYSIISKKLNEKFKKSKTSTLGPTRLPSSSTTLGLPNSPRRIWHMWSCKCGMENFWIIFGLKSGGQKAKNVLSCTFSGPPELQPTTNALVITERF